MHVAEHHYVSQNLEMQQLFCIFVGNLTMPITTIHLMITQSSFLLSPKRRGCHLITREVMEHLPKPLPEVGMLNLFVQHTSCALSINENADPDVRTDMSKIMDHLVREGEAYYDHTMEGLDDMPAHAKSSLFGVSLTIPITNGSLNLGTWQGIYLCEFRDYGGARRLVATIYS